MNNFFYDSSDYNLFKKALRKTGGEPVVINILSSDSSLKKDEVKKEQKVERKNFSSRFEPSPFGKFFGPQKQRTAPVDTNAFSSWKNKNYRRAEQSINESSNSAVKFSLSDYMNNKFGKTKFNELDEAKSNLQKPINQLSSDDPQYKRFSLDSFMSKLEQQRKVEEELKENDDILEPLGDEQNEIVPDSSQDEDFGFGSDTTIESVAMDDTISGEKFTFERSELDKIKNRLMKIEEEQANIKKKANEKIIEGNELSDLSNQEFDLGKLGFEEIEDEENSVETDSDLNKKEDNDKLKEDQKDEINDSKNLNSVEDVDKKEHESDAEEAETVNETKEENNSVEESETEEIEEVEADIEADFETEESENNIEPQTAKVYEDINGTPQEAQQEVKVISEYNDERYKEAIKLQQQQAEMQAKIIELIESNKQNDKSSEERIKQAELEKQQIEREYALKLKEIEDSYNRRYEEYKKQAYLGKLEEEAKIRSMQQDFAKSMQKSDIAKKAKKTSLKNELKTNLEKSNIEMDKKLLEIASAQNKNAKIQHRRNNAVNKETSKNEIIEEINLKSDKKSENKNNIDIGLQKKSTKGRRKKSSRRRIDGDIITDIDFE